MNPNQRFSLLVFPQRFDGQKLTLHILLLPRNQNPLSAALQGVPGVPNSAALADAQLSFVAKLVSGATGFASDASVSATVPLTTVTPANGRGLFEALAEQFQIKNKGALNTTANLEAFPQRAPKPMPAEKSVRKYLPLTYRKAFNFVAPRVRNAVTDESYHCSVRGAEAQPGFKQSPEEISWGKVFAHVLRQPLLAEKLGLLYRTEFTPDAALFEKGGWLFVDYADGSDFRAHQNADATFTRRYAARIPSLTAAQPRPVFATMLFPVAAVVPPGNYDPLLRETAEYDDGFSKVVHAHQAVSDNLLLEDSDGAHPTQDAGIRLGWDDEQLLIWYMRQLSEDLTVGAGQRIDAPLGVAGYKIDVRERRDGPGGWQSLNVVSSRQPLTLVNPTTNAVHTLGDFPKRELVYQVYPSRLDGDASKPFWLPMYFANWTGGSMVLPDGDAASIYRHDEAKAEPGINVKGAAKNNLLKLYRAVDLTTPLRYGRQYQFRVRLGDLTGGGPSVGDEPFTPARPQVADWHFKRFVAPNAVRFQSLPANSEDGLYPGNELRLRRPILSYPAVVYTGKYADPVALLKQASSAAQGEALGLPDPDVVRVEIIVEIQSLGLDTVDSVSGREHYVKFYQTTRVFPTQSPVFADELTIPLEYRDCNVLRFGNPANLGDLGLTQAEIDGQNELVLPTARTVRLTLRAVCEERPDYYGLEQADPAFNTRYGKTVQLQLYRPSTNERSLFVDTDPVSLVRGLFLQPDPATVFNGNPFTLLLGQEAERAPALIHRLAQELDVECNGLTLSGRKGQRIQFGCSPRIRHTLSPDNSSITFSSQSDLVHHWLCCLTLDLDRDWTWDALQSRSFVIERRKRFKEDDAATETETMEVGDVELKRSASFQALQSPDRTHTRVVFIDAVEPKNPRKRSMTTETRYPDLIELTYFIRPQFRAAHGGQRDDVLSVELELPITTPPAQVPRIVSAGLALSSYSPGEGYASTSPRRRVLWVEFAEPIQDSKDAYFARILSNAPDQLLSNNHPELLVVPDEPALALPPEPVRAIYPQQSHDHAGVHEMLLMEKATNSDRHYLVPLPATLHAESPEMFGFFTYEFRVGHYRYTDTTPHHQAGEIAWCTAHGRFGRELRITGVQHPAPTLTCTVYRDDEKLYATAPYAVAVANGKNVTATPPRTEIWALLYAQVQQADKQSARNLLLDDRVMDPLLRVKHPSSDRLISDFSKDLQLRVQRASVRNWNPLLGLGDATKYYEPNDALGENRDATKYGTVIWTNEEVERLLALYGLPRDSSLSVLCVETLPQITDVFEHVSVSRDPEVQEKLKSQVLNASSGSTIDLSEFVERRNADANRIDMDAPRPLSDHLGHHRILRTSPLTAVPFVCTYGPA